MATPAPWKVPPGRSSTVCRLQLPSKARISRWRSASMSSLLSGHYSELPWQKGSMLDKAARHRVFFFGEWFLCFCRGFWGKRGVSMWFFDGEFVVDCGDFVVNGWSYFGVEKYATDSGFIFGDSRFGNGFLPAVGSEGGFGLGREKQDEDQGFGGEHAEGGLLSVPVP